MSQANHNLKHQQVLKAKPEIITPRLLRSWPLPQPDVGDDKDARGRVLVVGGGPEMPGAIILAATAALRAGAGKLQIATASRIASQVAVAMPEAKVFALSETKSGSLTGAAISLIAKQANHKDAVLIGPGFADEHASSRLMHKLLQLIDGPTIVLDAAAMGCLNAAPDCLHKFCGKTIITPHLGEMAQISNIDKEEIAKDPLTLARQAAAQLQAIVALKGRETFIAAPDGKTYCNRTGNVGLATSGSGDTLAGIIVGLAARGAEPHQAAVWGCYLHGCAGDRLAKRIGPLGFLAREIPDEIPALMAKF